MHKLKVFRTRRINYAPARIVLLVLLSFSFVQADTSRNRGLLWEVTQAGIPASYLFGTIHSEDPEVVHLAAPVQKAFDASQAVVLEVLLDMNAMMAASAAMLLMDGRLLKDLVGESLFSRTATAMQARGMPVMMTEHMQPWAAAITLSMPVPETGRVLDVVLYEHAMQEGKQVHGLETIQEQLDVFATMPLANQVLLLEDAVEHYQQMDIIYAQLLSAWKQRDLARLVAINEDALASGDQHFADDFQQRLIVERNHLMVERMQPYLRQGKAFVAVGALHLPGDEGLLNLLEQRGYRVRAVY